MGAGNAHTFIRVSSYTAILCDALFRYTFMYIRLLYDVVSLLYA